MLFSVFQAFLSLHAGLFLEVTPVPFHAHVAPPLIRNVADVEANAPTPDPAPDPTPGVDVGPIPVPSPGPGVVPEADLGLQMRGESRTNLVADTDLGAALLSLTGSVIRGTE